MKKTKKALLAAIACSAALAAAFGLAACNKGDGHEHSWADDYTVDTPATCTTDGSKSIHCNGCDEIKDVEVIPAGHSWAEDYTVDTPATCTTNGSKSIHCNGCDQTKDAEVIPAGHSWAEEYTVDTPATCTTDGSKSIHCGECDQTKDAEVIPANGHDWNEWKITTMPTTEEDGTGIASKTCKVEGCEGQIQVILPNLNSEDYVRGKDSATCSAAGQQSYTYTDSDDNTVTFIVETPKKTVELTENASKTNGVTTITLPSGSSLNLGNWKYYECPDCGKLFSMNTDLKSDVARHVPENEIDFATKVSINVGSTTNFNGPAKIGDNKVYFTGKGGVVFKAEEAGVYKISPENATALFGLAYFGTTETGSTPSLVYKSGSTKDDKAKQYSRFNYTNFEKPDGIYVRMEAGDVVAVAYTCVTKVDNFKIEKIDNVSELTCYMHNGAYDVSEFDVDGGTLKYKCSVCGIELNDLDSKQPIIYTRGAEVNETNESSPVVITSGTTVVKTGVATGTYYSFTPSEAKDYEIIFDTALIANTLTLKGIKCGDDVAATYDTALVIDDAFKNIINIEKGFTTTIVTVKVGADNVDMPFTFNFDVAGASTEAPAYLTSVVNSNLPKFITAGESTVTITAAYEFSDIYYFVSEEGGRFSITVPEGVEMSIYGDFMMDVNNPTVANFIAPAGVRVGFAFKISDGTTGDLTVTVGDPVELTYKTVTTEAATTLIVPAKTASSGNFTGGVAIAEVGEIESGTYKLTVKLSPTLTGGGYLAFAKNKEGDAAYNNFYDNTGNVRVDEESATEAYVSTGNFQTQTINGVDYTVNYTYNGIWTITLDLQEGDLLLFANGTLTQGELTITLVKV